MEIDNMCFDYKLIKKEVTSSWSRCLKENKKRYVLKNKHFHAKNKSDDFSVEMKEYFTEVSDKLKQSIKLKHCLLLVNEQKTIEELIGDIHFKSDLKTKGINIGTSLKEKYSGTNAVQLAAKINKPVYILPGHHYCKPLNSWYSLAYPIKNNKKIIGFVNLISKDAISDQIICMMDLFSNNLSLKTNNKQKLKNNKDKINDLSYNQEYILKKLAKGYTERSLAKDMHLSKNTVKYHKKILFNKLDVSSKIELVMKAIKIGILSFEEV